VGVVFSHRMGEMGLVGTESEPCDKAGNSMNGRIELGKGEKDRLRGDKQ
jgi:hypothetical protein